MPVHHLVCKLGRGCWCRGINLKAQPLPYPPCGRQTSFANRRKSPKKSSFYKSFEMESLKHHLLICLSFYENRISAQILWRFQQVKYQPEFKCIKYYLEIHRTLQQKEPLRSPSSTTSLSIWGKLNPERFSNLSKRHSCESPSLGWDHNVFTLRLVLFHHTCPFLSPSF